jgi:putative endonuclease
MDTKEVGQKGGDLACEYLVKNGYKILGRNCALGVGEIDIVAKKSGLFADKTIHFVEVKSSEKSGDFFPEQRVGWKKINIRKVIVAKWILLRSRDKK